MDIVQQIINYLQTRIWKGSEWYDYILGHIRYGKLAIILVLLGDLPPQKNSISLDIRQFKILKNTDPFFSLCEQLRTYGRVVYCENKSETCAYIKVTTLECSTGVQGIIANNKCIVRFSDPVIEPIHPLIIYELDNYRKSFIEVAEEKSREVLERLFAQIPQVQNLNDALTTGKPYIVRIIMNKLHKLPNDVYETRLVLENHKTIINFSDISLFTFLKVIGFLENDDNKYYNMYVVFYDPDGPKLSNSICLDTPDSKNFGADITLIFSNDVKMYTAEYLLKHK